MTYYTKQDLYGEKFFQVPKVFFTNEFYKKGLKDREKIAFGMLKDRFSLSQKNGWFDENGRIYFIFSQVELMEVFDCSKQTASDIKKALIKCDLLEVKKWGQGKADWLYLKKPIVTDNDIYKIDKEENAQSLEALRKSKNQTSKSLKNSPQEVQKIDGINTDIKNTDINNTDSKSLVTSKDIIDFCNSLYTKYSSGRWSKRQWNTMIKKFVNETEWDTVNHFKAYCITSIEKMAYSHDYKNGKVDIEEKFSFEGQTVPFYNWLEQ